MQVARVSAKSVDPVDDAGVEVLEASRSVFALVGRMLLVEFTMPCVASEQDECNSAAKIQWLAGGANFTVIPYGKLNGWTMKRSFTSAGRSAGLAAGSK